MSKTFRKSARGLKAELCSLHERAIAVRKLLRKLGAGPGKMSGELQLVKSIERLVRRAQRCGAQEAVRIADMIELLISVLEAKID